MRSAAAHAIFRVLRDWGCDVVFVCPGSTEAAFLDVSSEYPEVRLVLVTHEAIAMSAADGYARRTGKPTVAYVHANVGLANAIAHLHCAALANSPVVLLTGIKSTIISGRGGFTTAPVMTDYVRQHVRYAHVSLRGDAMADDLVRALNAATNEPGGPVFLGLPQDLLETDGEIVTPNVARRRVASRRMPEPGRIAAASDVLAHAQRLTIVAGSEIVRADARHALIALAKLLDAPMLIEDRRSIESNGIALDDPRYAGSYDRSLACVRDADAIFFAGARSPMEFEPPRESAYPRQARIVQLHSDPSELAKVDELDVALAGNARLAIDALHAALAGHVPSKTQAEHTRTALATYRASATTIREALQVRTHEVPIAPAALMTMLGELLPSDATIVGDPVTSGGYVIAHLLAHSARSYLTTSGGSLGWGMGAPIGVSLASGDERIYAIVGDGVVQFGLPALFTAVALKLPITYIVVDNASYAAVRAALKRYRGPGGTGPFPASDLSGPDLAAIARGFGSFGTRVERLGDLAGALAAADAAGGPAVIVVQTDPTHTGP